MSKSDDAHADNVLAAIFAAYHSKSIKELESERGRLFDELEGAVILAQKMIDLVIAQKRAKQAIN